MESIELYIGIREVNSPNDNEKKNKTKMVIRTWISSSKASTVVPSPERVALLRAF